MVICWGAEEISNKSVTTNAVDIVPWTSMLSMKSTGTTTALLLWMRISCFQSDMTVKVFVTVGLCCCDRTVNVVSVFIKVLRVFCNVLCRFYYVGPGVSGLGEGFAAWALLIFSRVCSGSDKLIVCTRSLIRANFQGRSSHSSFDTHTYKQKHVRLIILKYSGLWLYNKSSADV